MVLENRHQFVYCEAGNKREEVLKQLIDDNPVVLDENIPSVIYVDEFNISDVQAPKKVDILTLRLLKEYINFSIAYNILSRVITDVSSDILSERQEQFLSRINNFYSTNISSLDELLKLFEDTRTFYKMCYVNYSANGRLYNLIDKLPIRFLHLSFIVEELKQMLNNNSYFALIFEQQESMNVIFQRLINNFISSRINGDFSVKVVCAPEDWESYVDSNGTLIESIHDYWEVDVDGSFKKLVIKNNRKYSLNDDN